MAANRLTLFLLKISNSQTAGIIGHIALDVIKTAALLASLSIVHWVAEYSLASEQFKALFLTIHDSISLGLYLLLAWKGMLRLARKS
jgi:hypothetical protein